MESFYGFSTVNPEELIYVEHVNAKIKTFQIRTQKYRNRRKQFNLRFNLICGLINFDHGFQVGGR